MLHAVAVIVVIVKIVNCCNGTSLHMHVPNTIWGLLCTLCLTIFCFFQFCVFFYTQPLKHSLVLDVTDRWLATADAVSSRCSHQTDVGEEQALQAVWRGSQQAATAECERRGWVCCSSVTASFVYSRRCDWSCWRVDCTEAGFDDNAVWKETGENNSDSVLQPDDSQWHWESEPSNSRSANDRKVLDAETTPTGPSSIAPGTRLSWSTSALTSPR